MPASTREPTDPRRARLLTLVRSFLAGGLATLSDLGTLVFAMSVLHLPARQASLPALLVGGVVNFVGNRHFAFRAGRGSLQQQAALYTVTEAVALALNGVLFDLCVRALPPSTPLALPLRLATSNAVFLLWSYPVWRRIFTAPREGEGRG